MAFLFLIFGFLRKENRKSTIKTGLIFLAIPVMLFLIALLYTFAYNIFTEKPTGNDLIGTYHIVDAGGKIPKKLYNSYKPEFKADKTFYL